MGTSNNSRQGVGWGVWLVGAWTVAVAWPSWVLADRPAEPNANTTGQALYGQHCAACHGETGHGDGVAATFLYPKPRNLAAGAYKLISTTNKVPTRDDILAVLRRGMPGSSMPSWQHLSDDQLGAIAAEVLRLREVGMRAAYTELLRQEEELTDDELASDDVQSEINDYVTSRTVPGEITATPKFGEPTSAAVAAGRDNYARFGCISCHGETGRGDGVETMYDDERYPTFARDFTKGVFKGGHDPESLYRRVAYGMPGTPMPSSSTMTPEQMVDLVHYMRSLSTEEQRQATLLRRQQFVAKRLASLPNDLNDDAWAACPPVGLTMTPLWWRNDADPGLRVQVAHDGQQVAMRLTWQDESQNERAVSPEEFADMVAVEFCRAGAEPFLGMGDASQPVDMWQWRAGSVQLAADMQLMDDYPFDSPEYARLQTGDKIPDFVTARAAGNLLTTRRGPASQMAAQGPGSSTFLPRPSQVVDAQATWQAGRWTVVLRRPLSVSDAEGLELTAGGAYAVAFAVWNGEFRDRASQKVISIWNDLVLE